MSAHDARTLVFRSSIARVATAFLDSNGDPVATPTTLTATVSKDFNAPAASDNTPFTVLGTDPTVYLDLSITETTASFISVVFSCAEAPDTVVHIHTESLVFLESGTVESTQANGLIALELAVAQAIDDYYNGTWIRINSGVGSGQVSKIIDYNGTTKIATLDRNWGSEPQAADTYSIGITSGNRVIEFANPVPPMDLQSILGTAVTETTAANVASNFSGFFDNNDNPHPGGTEAAVGLIDIKSSDSGKIFYASKLDSVVSGSSTPSTTVFRGGGFTATGNGYFDGQCVYFNGGVLDGMSFFIESSTDIGTTIHEFTIEAAMPVAPTVGEGFSIFGTKGLL